jgi:hypothetical protein
VNLSPPTLLELDLARKPKGLRAFFFLRSASSSLCRLDFNQQQNLSLNQKLKLSSTYFSTELATGNVGKVTSLHEQIF